MSLHRFDPEVASMVGVNAATIYENILHWCAKNYANSKHIHDQKPWTYNSLKAFEELFEYLSPNQIRTALKKLKDADFIEVGEFNKAGYDRTKWYTLGGCEKSQMHLLKITNGDVKNHRPIPDKKPINKHIPPVAPHKSAAVAHVSPHFQPNMTNIRKAHDLGFTEEQIYDALAEFIEYWGARRDAKAKKTDRGWQLAFGNNLNTLASRWGTGRNKNATGGSEEFTGLAGAARELFAVRDKMDPQRDGFGGYEGGMQSQPYARIGYADD